MNVIVCYECYGFWDQQKGKVVIIGCVYGSTSDFCYAILRMLQRELGLLTEGL